MPYDRKLVLVFSDTHGGSKHGLCNPDADTIETIEQLTPQGVVEDAFLQKVSINSTQKYLWALYEKVIENVMKIAGEDPVIAMHNGDLTQGNKYKTHLMTEGMENQYRIAAYNMLPLFSIPTLHRIFFIQGTESHIGFEGIAPHQVQLILSSDEFREMGSRKIPIETANHALISIDDYLIDIAHHGAFPGSRKWLTGNIVRYNMKSDVISSAMSQSEIPDIYIRSHYHTPVEESLTEFIDDEPVRTKSIITPSFQGMNQYARQATRSKPAVTNGAVLLEIVNGKLLDIYWLMNTIDIRVKKEIIV